MRKFFKYLPYYLVVFFFYCPLYGLFILLSSNPDLTGLYLLNIFIIRPLQFLQSLFFIATDLVFHYIGFQVVACSMALLSFLSENLSLFISQPMKFLFYQVQLLVPLSGIWFKKLKTKNFHKILEKSRNHAIIMHRDKSLRIFLLESAGC